MKSLPVMIEDPPAREGDATSLHWAVDLLRRASERVPAYARFLAAHATEVDQIESLDDFARVPIVTKENYLNSFPFRQLLWDGSFDRSRVISTSSGSSGKPYYWPRGENSQADAVALNDRILTHLGVRGRETLCINAFAMGTYVAGTYQLAAMMSQAGSGHRVTTICTGIDIEDNIRALSDLAGEFERVVIMGYPPLVRDILEQAKRAGVALPEGRIRLIFAGENFSERWRDHVHCLAGATDPLGSSLSIYGTADAGIIGAETPFTVYVRRLAATDDSLSSLLFPDASTLPSLVAVDPRRRYMEDVDGRIVFTVDNALPLIRYAIGDIGRILSVGQVTDLLASRGYQVPDGIAVDSDDQIVSLSGRPDVAAMFYSVNLYPENIKDGLEQQDLAAFLSGKFILSVAVDEETMDQVLSLRVELASGAAPSAVTAGRVRDAVTNSLIAANQEYRRLHQLLAAKAEPRVELVSHGAPDFRVAIKHRWAAPQ